jgi:hypothetical protein
VSANTSVVTARSVLSEVVLPEVLSDDAQMLLDSALRSLALLSEELFETMPET